MIGQAQTGSGKTAAFGLPMIEHVDPVRARGPGARAHADARAVHPGHAGAAHVRPAQGRRRRRRLRRRADPLPAGPAARRRATIVVGTVGRVLDLIQRASLILHNCRFVVLDEADEMLDLGFLEDVERILTITPNSRQTALFSATMPPPIRKLADRYLYDPVTVKVKSANADRRHASSSSRSTSSPATRPTSSSRCSRAERPDQAIVFARTKIRCDQLFRRLRDRGLNVKRAARRHVPGPARRRDARLQGRPRADPRGHRRRRARPGHLHRHPRRQLRRARRSPDVYVHRIGRTGRVGRAGRAITFVEPRQQRELEAIEHHIGTGDHAVGRGRDDDARPGRRAPAPALQAAALARRRRAAGQARRRRRAARRASRSPTSSTPSPSAAGIDGEAVRDVRVLERFSLPRRARAARPSASSTPSTARRSTARRCASRSRAAEPLVRPQPRLAFARLRRCVQPWTCEAARGRACPCAGSGAPGPTGERRRSSRRAAPEAARTCAPAARRMEAEQDWCLSCGTAAPGRLGERPGWRAASTVHRAHAAAGRRRGRRRLRGADERPTQEAAAAAADPGAGGPARRHAAGGHDAAAAPEPPTTPTRGQPKPLPKVQTPASRRTQGRPSRRRPTPTPTPRRRRRRRPRAPAGPATGTGPARCTTPTTPADTGPSRSTLNGDAGALYDPYSRVKASGEATARARRRRHDVVSRSTPTDARAGRRRLRRRPRQAAAASARSARDHADTPGFRVEVYATDEADACRPTSSTRAGAHLADAQRRRQRRRQARHAACSATARRPSTATCCCGSRSRPTDGAASRIAELKLLG